MSLPPETHDPLDRSQIEFLVSLDDGQAEVLAAIVREYLIVGEECSTELVRQLGEGDCRAVDRAAHALKGASANVGATGLTDVSAAGVAGTQGRAEWCRRARGPVGRGVRPRAGRPGDCHREGVTCRS